MPAPAYHREQQDNSVSSRTGTARPERDCAVARGLGETPVHMSDQPAHQGICLSGQSAQAYAGWLSRAFNRSYHWLLPPTCAICYRPGQPTLDLCASCHARSEQILRPCLQCGRPLRDHHQSDICHQCSLSHPAYDRVVIPFRYATTIQSLILQAKYQRKLASTRILGQLLADVVPSGTVDALIAAPAHYRTLGWRGYNQSLEIGREVSRRTGIPLLRQGCWKIRATPRQAGLGARQRQHNLAGVYRARLPRENLRIAVIDDVMTTGATLNEIAHTLKGCGASHVEGWICARAT